MPSSRRPRGVNRRALGRALTAAHWITPADEAAVVVARDLADRLDALRAEQSLFGDPKTAWHVANIAAKYLAALTALQLTPESRPAAEVDDDGADLIAKLRAVPASE